MPRQDAHSTVPTLVHSTAHRHTPFTTPAQEAKKFERGEGNGGVELVPDAITYGCVLGVLERQGAHDRVAEVRVAMEKAGVVVDRKKNGAVVRRNRESLATESLQVQRERGDDLPLICTEELIP